MITMEQKRTGISASLAPREHAVSAVLGGTSHHNVSEGEMCRQLNAPGYCGEVIGACVQCRSDIQDTERSCMVALYLPSTILICARVDVQAGSPVVSANELYQLLSL